MMRAFFTLTALGLTACVASQDLLPYQPTPQQGQYIYPQRMQPTPPPRLPNTDLCNAQLYQSLLGRPEGTIYFAALPNRTRVIKPAALEDFDRDDNSFLDPVIPRVEVREYLPGQPIYLSSVRIVEDATRLGPEIRERLTLELDRGGSVSRVSCR